MKGTEWRDVARNVVLARLWKKSARACQKAAEDGFGRLLSTRAQPVRLAALTLLQASRVKHPRLQPPPQNCCSRFRRPFSFPPPSPPSSKHPILAPWAPFPKWTSFDLPCESWLAVYGTVPSLYQGTQLDAYRPGTQFG